LRDRQPEGLGGLEVDDQLELGGLFDRQVTGFRSFQNSPYNNRRLSPHLKKTRPVRNEATLLRVLSPLVDRRKAVACREVSDGLL
jgi:hypothetical protein